ncbi:CpaF family protein [Candidatus Pacearchaeota archaeon]|nr:CpaF family protein [Candidatus Pacearchaeota archaeon]
MAKLRKKSVKVSKLTKPAKSVKVEKKARRVKSLKKVKNVRVEKKVREKKSLKKIKKVKVEKKTRKVEVTRRGTSWLAKHATIPKQKKQVFVKEKGVIDSYDIDVNGVKISVKILATEEGKGYDIELPKVSIATSALLDSIKQKIVESPDINIEANEPASMEIAKKRIRQKAAILLSSYKIDQKTIEQLIGILINDMLGLGNIDILVNDPQLEEIVINDRELVRVYHKNYGWLSTNFSIESEKQIENYASIIARRIGRQITNLNPMLDAHLLTGDRVNAVLMPVSTKGNTITIRKFAREPWTVVDFIKNGTCSSEVFALIWTAMQYELNILFSGGTASGKTSMLNVCMPFIPSNHRIISIEDTRELQLPEYLYWTPLVTRLPNPEGKGAVTMLDLLVNSLRMRPDRIVLGEMRRQAEAEVLFEAMHTGHSVYATVHADSAAETISRLINPPLNVPPNLLKTVDLCLVMFRDRRRGIRRVYQVAEFVAEESAERAAVRPNILFRWDPTTDKIVKHLSSLRFLEDLSRNTGMSNTEIIKDLALKKQILDYLVKNNLRKMEEVSKIIQKFYIDPESVRKIIT